MKPWIILIVLAVALTGVVTVSLPYLSSESVTIGPEHPAPPKAEGPAPKLVINDPMTFSMGIVGQDSPGSHEWTFKNEGQGLLEVRGTSTSCSCTTSDLFEGKELKAGPKVGKLIKIEPGESKQITVNWNTKTFQGNYRQFVSLATNDPEKPTIELAVQGTIKLALVTYPDPSVSFKDVSNDEPAMRRIAISSPDRPETKITKITSSNPELIAATARELPPEEAARLKYEKGYWVEITLKPTPTLAEFSEEVIVETDHPLTLKKPLSIKVKGKVVGPISVIPEKIEMRNATSSDGGSQELTIWARRRPSVNFTVASKPEGVDVTIAPLPAMEGSKGSSYKMSVKLAPGLESGLIAGEVVLKTDEPQANEIHIPVSVLVKGAR